MTSRAAFSSIAKQRGRRSTASSRRLTKAREIAVLKPGGGLRLLSSDGQAIRVSELEELGMTCYAPLTAAEKPAGVSLARGNVF